MIVKQHATSKQQKSASHISNLRPREKAESFTQSKAKGDGCLLCVNYAIVISVMTSSSLTYSTYPGTHQLANMSQYISCNILAPSCFNVCTPVCVLAGLKRCETMSSS